MSEHPAVTFLRAAHRQAEEIARAAHAYKLLAAPGSPSPDGWVIDEAMCLLKAGVPTAEHIVLHSPSAVLRRVSAEWEQLAEHQPTREAPARRSDAWEPCDLPGCSCAVDDWVPGCGTCAPGDPYDSTVAHCPCRTVLLLAEGWGWGPSAPS